MATRSSVKVEEFSIALVDKLREKRFNKRKEQRAEISALQKIIREAEAEKKLLLQRMIEHIIPKLLQLTAGTGNKNLRIRLRDLTECLRDCTRTVEEIRRSILNSGAYADDLHGRLMEELKDMNVFAADDSDCCSDVVYEGD
ncbi:hypothetical protein CC2G_000226 [Coprinopsis cinerea AmutBmut pab1-1]|nr:hypothetical protein CC2G_000226 [Coprinopsis cinerea AmutBmut pab1-1]